MLNLIPTPKKHQMISEEFHPLRKAIHCDKGAWRDFVEAFRDNFQKAFHVKLEDGFGGIELIEDAALAADAYRIESGDTFRIYASGNEGICYGLASAFQLIRAGDGALSVQHVTVEDWPEKDYRAFMVDLGRVWHPFKTLLHYVNICFLFKVKYLHLHFIDEHVYTLPSKVLPNLPTEGEHYTFEEIAYLNEFAKARNVVLVPEFECPGHTQQFLKKYPEIFGDKLTCQVNEKGEKLDLGDTICATGEKSWEATKALLKEISDMFPDSPYINVGGDEANIGIWNYCEDCKRYMEEHGLKDEYALYSDYVARVTDYVFTLGKTPMVFEGFPPEGSEKINKDTIVFAWDSSYFLAPDLLKAGFRIINASWKPMYIIEHLRVRWSAFDLLQWDPYVWTSHAPSNVSHLNPIRVQPTDQVLGGMLCEWESCYEMSIQRDMENLAAMAEKTWTVRRLCNDVDYSVKYQKLQHMARHVIRER